MQTAAGRESQGAAECACAHGTTQPQRAVQTHGKAANSATNQQHCILLVYSFASCSRLRNWRLVRAILPCSVFGPICSNRALIVAYVSEATPCSPSHNTHPPISYNTRRRFPPYVQQVEPGVNSIYSILRISRIDHCCFQFTLTCSTSRPTRQIILPLSMTRTTSTRNFTTVTDHHQELRAGQAQPSNDATLLRCDKCDERDDETQRVRCEINKDGTTSIGR